MLFPTFLFNGAAIFFLLMPYHVNQIYNASLYAEFAATAILPFCFFFATRLVRHPGMGGLVGLSLSFGFLILTHLPLTVIGSICLLIYCLCILEKDRRVRSIALLALSVTISLAATSFYWIRMVMEFSIVKVTAAEFTQNEFDFRSNFLLSGLINATQNYSDRTLLFIDIMLVLTIAVAAIGLVLYRSKAGESKTVMPLVILLAFSAFFTLPVSSPIWENISPLARVQFPWRWLAVISAAGALLAGAGVPKLLEMFRSARRSFAIGIFGVAAIFASFTMSQVIRPATYTPPDRFLSWVQDLGSKESCECLWPIWARKEALQNKELLVAGGRATQIIDWSSARRTLMVSSGEKQDLRVATFYYPFWHAKIDGNPADVSIGPFGEILIPLHEAPSHIELSFEEPHYFWTAVIVSGISGAAAVILLLIGIVLGGKKPTSPHAVVEPRQAE